MQSKNLSNNEKLTLEEEDSIENYLLGLNLNQGKIVTLSKTSKKLGIEMQITQAVFDQLEKKGILRKKYALLCPNCSHILDTSFDFEDLITSTKHQTCCSGDEEFRPTKEDIYVFFEVNQQKKDIAPVQNAKNVITSKNVTQGQITNFDKNDTLTEYQRRDLEYKERTAIASEQASENISEISKDYKEERDLARKELGLAREEQNEYKKKNKQRTFFRRIVAVILFGILICIKIYETDLDVSNTFQAIGTAISILALAYE